VLAQGSNRRGAVEVDVHTVLLEVVQFDREDYTLYGVPRNGKEQVHRLGSLMNSVPRTHAANYVLSVRIDTYSPSTWNSSPDILVSRFIYPEAIMVQSYLELLAVLDSGDW
jgi:hypothetical protein